MSEIYVVGHKNPDADSICSTYAYSRLKNRMDPSNRYMGVRCGNVNKQTRFIFDRFGLEPPPFIKDVYPRVSDVMTRSVVSMDENDPVFEVVRNTQEYNFSLTPVTANGSLFRGLASLTDISEFHASPDLEKKPVYNFRATNFEKTIRGYVYRRGARDDFRASVMIGAMPFEKFRSRMESSNGPEILLVVGLRKDILQYAIEKGVSAVLLTGVEDQNEIEMDFSGFDGWIYISSHDTAETVRRLLLSLPADNVMETSVPTVDEEEYLEVARDIVLKAELKGLPVLREDRLVGIITRSDFIKKTHRNLILMDHNELDQAVDGAEQASILEIVDHHRLGTIKTRNPIHFFARPVGSTCTLVHQLYAMNGLVPESETAGVLLAGVLSDTLRLKSPTTTDEDRRAVVELGRMSGLDPGDFGNEIFAVADSLKTRDTENIVSSDFKIYSEYGIAVGIGQAESATLDEIAELQSNLEKELDRLRAEKHLDWAMLLVTDIGAGDSALLTTDFPAGQKLLAFNRAEEGYYQLPGVLSRKKQLLPEILRVLEELNG